MLDSDLQVLHPQVGQVVVHKAGAHIRAQVQDAAALSRSGGHRVCQPLNLGQNDSRLVLGLAQAAQELIRGLLVHKLNPGVVLVQFGASVGQGGDALQARDVLNGHVVCRRCRPDLDLPMGGGGRLGVNLRGEKGHGGVGGWKRG